ncbi:presenilin family intramembrane aspartyl protease PSH [Halocalculus aciditolerans]|uniref:Presenilin-like membrane protease, A22 family n=1 Tax=Halocalculus aciditolerans TaxID=1383812 RepID=A0A830F5F8_9EURY|nr:presenilin family intramembrane aspartyl protease PSH [Halocalculus aciditolerans]GGL56528.1 hypothetical protein GCM10009039_13320 [Halocalculus aciditolerans]
MNQRQRVSVAVVGTAALFLAVQLGALALVGPFEAAGYQTVPNPQDPTNSLLYVGVLLVATAGILAAIKLGGESILRYFIVATSGLVTAYVFSVVLPPLAVAGANVTPWVGAAVVMGALLFHPEWYVLDAAGVLMGMGAAGLFGISFGILPAIILLSLLAIYDAISVYRTKHMLTLASGVMRLRVPVLLVIPVTLGYSYLEEAEEMAERTDDQAAADDGEPEADADGDGDAGGDATAADGEGEEADEGFERDALFIGLGDAVMPTILVASAAFFLDAPAVLGVELPALGAIVGTLAGLMVLLRMVLKGRAHAGLPLLNGGAIFGYLVGALLSGYGLVGALGLGPYL